MFGQSTSGYDFNRMDYILPEEDPLVLRARVKGSHPLVTDAERWKARLVVRMPTIEVVRHTTRIGTVEIETRDPKERHAGTTVMGVRINYALAPDAIVLGRVTIFGTIKLFPPFGTLEQFGGNWERLQTVYGGDVEKFVRDPDNPSRNFTTRAAATRHELIHYNSHVQAAQTDVWIAYGAQLRVVQDKSPWDSAADVVDDYFQSKTRQVWNKWSDKAEGIMPHEEIHRAELRGIVEQYAHCCIRKLHP